MAPSSDVTPPTPPIHKWGRPAGATEGYLAIGRILGPWRNSPKVVVESLTDFPDRFDPGQPAWIRGIRYKIEAREQHGSKFVLKLSGIEAAESAERLKGVYVEVPESEQRTLEPDIYYEFQIVGLRVRTEDGQPIGTVSEILHTGSNDVYVVKADGNEVLVPAIDDVVKRVDVDRGEIVIELIEGLLPEKRRST